MRHCRLWERVHHKLGHMKTLTYPGSTLISDEWGTRSIRNLNSLQSYASHICIYNIQGSSLILIHACMVARFQKLLVVDICLCIWRPAADSRLNTNVFQTCKKYMLLCIAIQAIHARNMRWTYSATIELRIWLGSIAYLAHWAAYTPVWPHPGSYGSRWNNWRTFRGNLQVHTSRHH